MTIEEKIARIRTLSQSYATKLMPEWQEECEQLAAWLRELAGAQESAGDCAVR